MARSTRNTPLLSGQMARNGSDLKSGTWGDPADGNGRTIRGRRPAVNECTTKQRGENTENLHFRIFCTLQKCRSAEIFSALALKVQKSFLGLQTKVQIPKVQKCRIWAPRSASAEVQKIFPRLLRFPCRRIENEK